MSKVDRISCFEKWEIIARTIPSSINDYDRSRYHYIGYCLWWGKKFFISNIISTVILPFALLIATLRNTTRITRSVDQENLYRAVITCPNKAYLLKDGDIPQIIKDRYSLLIKVEQIPEKGIKRITSLKLDRQGIILVLQCIKRNPTKGYMNLYILEHLSKIYRIMEQYHPSAIVTTQTEQDFSTSLVTKYCEEKDVKYVGIQHGEYCYNPSMAYVRYSEYYAWNEQTIKILELTNTQIDYAYIYIPERLKPQYKKKINPTALITYYLSSETLEDLIKVRDLLLGFVEKGYICRIRKHPRFLDENKIRELIANTGIQLENVKTVSLGDSLSDTEYIVAYRSTVLFEGYINSMNIVIDDVLHDIGFLQRLHDPNLERTDMRLSTLISQYL